jgi:hypothetical protein
MILNDPLPISRNWRRVTNICGGSQKFPDGHQTCDQREISDRWPTVTLAPQNCRRGRLPYGPEQRCENVTTERSEIHKSRGRRQISTWGFSFACSNNNIIAAHTCEHRKGNANPTILLKNLFSKLSYGRPLPNRKELSCCALYLELGGTS